MANKYAILPAATVSNFSSTGTWSDTSGGATGAVVPTLADDVIIDNLSVAGAGAVLIVDAQSYCKGFTTVGCTNTPTLRFAHTMYLNIYGDAVLENMLIDVAAGWTYGDIRFAATSGTQTLTTNGVSIGTSMQRTNSATGELSLLDNVVCTKNFSIYGGILTTNDHNITCNILGDASSNTAKTFNLGATQFTGARWNITGSNSTVNTGTSLLTVTGDQFNGGGKAYYDVMLSGTVPAIAGSNSYRNLSRIGTATKTNTFTVAAGTTQTVTGTLAIKGNSVVNRMLVQSGTLGSQATFNAAITDIENTDFMDIVGVSSGIKLTIAAGAVGEDLTDYPVYVKLAASCGISAADLTGIFGTLGANSLKMKMLAADKATECYVEVVSWDEANLVAELHFKAPSLLTGSDNIFYLTYSAAWADNTTYIGVTGSAAAQAVWSADFIAVYHMGDNPANSAQILDSTGNALTLAKQEVGGPVETAGLVGKAQDFDGVNDRAYKSSALFDLTSAFTFEAVFTPEVIDQEHRLGGSLTYPSSKWKGYGLVIGTDEKLRFYTGDGVTSYADTLTSAGAVAVAGNASVIAATYDSALGTNQKKMFIDGVFSAQQSITMSVAVSGTYYRVGSILEYKNAQGVIDEHRISSVARSAGWMAATNLTIRDILVTYTTAFNLSAITGLSGDCLGNSGITFTASAAQTWDGTTGSWSTAAKWTSRTPLPQDDVSAGGTGVTITMDMPRVGRDVTFTGTATITKAITINVFGSYILTGNIIYSNVAYYEYLRGRGSHDINSAGKTLRLLYVYAPDSVYTLQANLTLVNNIQLDKGTFDFNDFDCTLNAINYGYFSSPRTLILGNGAITTKGTGNVFSLENATIVAEGSTLVIDNALATACTFSGSNQSYHNLVIQGAGAYALTVTGNNAFTGSITVDRSQAAKTVLLTAGTQQALNQLVIPVSGTTVATIQSTTGTPATLALPAGQYTAFDYLAVTNVTVTDTDKWYAGAHSSDGGGNTGWIWDDFSLAPAAIASLEAFGGCRLDLYTHPGGIASLEAFGTARVDLTILAAAIASGEAHGLSRIDLILLSQAIASGEAIGIPRLDMYLGPGGIASLEAFGLSRLDLEILAAAIGSGESFGPVRVWKPFVLSGSARTPGLSGSSVMKMSGASSMGGM